MLTIRAEIIKSKQMSYTSYNVKLRFTLGKQVKRVSTNLFVLPNELTKNQKFKSNSATKKLADRLVAEYYEKISKLQIDLNNHSLIEIFKILSNANQTLQNIVFLNFLKIG